MVQKTEKGRSNRGQKFSQYVYLFQHSTRMWRTEGHHMTA